MSGRWRSAWDSQTALTRAIAVVLAALLGLALYLPFIRALESSRIRTRSNVAALRVDAVKLERNAQEIARLRAGASKQPAGDVRALVDASSRAAGLGAVRIDAKGPDEAGIVAGSVSFAAWLAWVAALDKQQVRLVTCRIEPLSTTGLVSVTATFVRARP